MTISLTVVYLTYIRKPSKDVVEFLTPLTERTVETVPLG